MDKGRHPHVVRTWTVERTKVPFRPAQQPLKARPNPKQEPFRSPDKHSGPPSPPGGKHD